MLFSKLYPQKISILGYIYYPQSNLCYSPYRQGPCARNQILTLPVGQNIPECARNPCQRDGYVNFRGNCYLINKAGPCELSELSFVVGVNVTTLAVSCIAQNELTTRFGDEENVLCPRGCQRWLEGKCTVNN